MGNEASSSLPQHEKKQQQQQHKVGQIVVVKEKPKNSGVSKEAETIARLEECPKFQPLVPNLLQRADARPLSTELVHPLSHNGTKRLLAHLHSHSSRAAANLHADQRRVCAEVKRLDQLAAAVMQRLVERQRNFAKLAHHSTHVDGLAQALDRVAANVRQAEQLAAQLNMLLPEQHRIQENEIDTV